MLNSIQQILVLLHPIGSKYMYLQLLLIMYFEISGKYFEFDLCYIFQ